MSVPSNLDSSVLSQDKPVPLAMSDDDLASVAGGQRIVFKGEGFARDSWFVSFMTKRIIQDSIRRELGRTMDAVPQEIVVEGRRYLVSQTGDTIFVEEAPQ